MLPIGPERRQVDQTPRGPAGPTALSDLPIDTLEQVGALLEPSAVAALGQTNRLFRGLTRTLPQVRSWCQKDARWLFANLPTSAISRLLYDAELEARVDLNRCPRGMMFHDPERVDPLSAAIKRGDLGQVRLLCKSDFASGVIAVNFDRAFSQRTNLALSYLTGMAPLRQVLREKCIFGTPDDLEEALEPALCALGRVTQGATNLHRASAELQRMPRGEWGELMDAATSLKIDDAGLLIALCPLAPAARSSTLAVLGSLCPNYSSPYASNLVDDLAAIPQAAHPALLTLYRACIPQPLSWFWYTVNFVRGLVHCDSSEWAMRCGLAESFLRFGAPARPGYLAEWLDAVRAIPTATLRAAVAVLLEWQTPGDHHLRAAALEALARQAPERWQPIIEAVPRIVAAIPELDPYSAVKLLAEGDQGDCTDCIRLLVDAVQAGAKVRHLKDIATLYRSGRFDCSRWKAYLAEAGGIGWKKTSFYLSLCHHFKEPQLSEACRHTVAAIHSLHVDGTQCLASELKKYWPWLGRVADAAATWPQPWRLWNFFLCWDTTNAEVAERAEALLDMLNPAASVAAGATARRDVLRNLCPTGASVQQRVELACWLWNMTANAAEGAAWAEALAPLRPHAAAWWPEASYADFVKGLWRSSASPGAKVRDATVIARATIVAMGVADVSIPAEFAEQVAEAASFAQAWLADGAAAPVMADIIATFVRAPAAARPFLAQAAPATGEMDPPVYVLESLLRKVLGEEGIGGSWRRTQ